MATIIGNGKSLFNGRCDKIPFSRLIGGFTVLILLVFLLFPIYWMIITSLKKNIELYDLSANPVLIRDGLTFFHYKYLLNKTEFVRWFLNSVIISVSSLVITLFLSIFAAYGIVCIKFKGKKPLAMGIFITYMIPPTLLFIPLYQVLSKINLIDSLISLILIYPTFTVPFATWLLMGFFRTVPVGISECAHIDGANRFQILFKIIIPITIPGIINVCIFSFIQCWSHFLYGMAFINKFSLKPLSVGIVTELIRGDVFFWGSLMAGAFIACVPIILLYFSLRKYFIGGLTAGAIKG